MPSWRFLSSLTYLFLVLVTACVVLLSCFALLSQAVRNSPRQAFKNNYNALVIGASYTLVCFFSMFFCLKRRIAMRLRMSRISKDYRPVSRGDVPHSVHEYITREYLRSCLISSLSIPTTSSHPGWGSHGTPFAGVHFRSTILSTVKVIDELAREVIPHHPPLKPHTRMHHHFRFIAPLLNGEVLALWDSAIQMARLAQREMTEEEFIVGWDAAEEIRRMQVDSVFLSPSFLMII
ncbi:hypothetical protein BDZ89DRAFT_1127908 [Hymenopellis radicata]|nr:hypothetical protein BDZ89DRAFT_1127908 [Hymenopellis radicata]